MFYVSVAFLFATLCHILKQNTNGKHNILILQGILLYMNSSQFLVFEISSFQIVLCATVTQQQYQSNNQLFNLRPDAVSLFSYQYHTNLSRIIYANEDCSHESKFESLIVSVAQLNML